MFDNYEPVPDIHCPCCAELLSDWQGKGGPCVLVTWRQGELHPVRGAFSSSEPKELQLDDGETYIYTSCERCYLYVEAVCSIANGVWMSTQLELGLSWPNSRCDMIAQAIERFIENCPFEQDRAHVAEALARLSKTYLEP